MLALIPGKKQANKMRISWKEEEEEKKNFK